MMYYNSSLYGEVEVNDRLYDIVFLLNDKGYITHSSRLNDVITFTKMSGYIYLSQGYYFPDYMKKPYLGIEDDGHSSSYLYWEAESNEELDKILESIWNYVCELPNFEYKGLVPNCYTIVYNVGGGYESSFVVRGFDDCRVRQYFEDWYGDNEGLTLLGVYKLDKHSLYICPVYKEEKEEKKYLKSLR